MLVMENINLYGNTKSVAAVTLHIFFNLTAVLTTGLNCVSFVQEEDRNYGPCSKTSDLRPFSGVGYYAFLNKKFRNGIAFPCCCVVGNWFLLYSKRSFHVLYFSTVKRSLTDQLNSAQVFDLFDLFMWILVFQVMTPCPLGGGYQHFAGTHYVFCRHLFGRRGLRYAFPGNYCNTKWLSCTML
jgi:hypothetical protein